MRVFPGTGWNPAGELRTVLAASGPQRPGPGQARPGTESQAAALVCANRPVFGLERGGGPAAAVWALAAVCSPAAGLDLANPPPVRGSFGGERSDARKEKRGSGGVYMEL